MSKIKLCVILGGSTESEISVWYTQIILKELDKEKYEIFLIYLGKNGKWYKFLEKKNIELVEEIKNKEEITNVFKYLEI